MLSRAQWLILAAGLLATGRATDALAQAMVPTDIVVDATSAGTPLERIWPYYGYDEVNFTSSPPGEGLLRTLGSIDTVAPHVRTHFLLNTGSGKASLKWGSTNVYTEDGAGNPIYNWELTDGILDSMTMAGALPLVELGFMPQALSAAPASVAYQNSGVSSLDGGCFYPPKDYSKWAALISEWAKHAKGRYPDIENSWQWELWNEPDIGYWRGTAAEYFKLYDYTEAALHQVLPSASLGGPAVVGVGNPLFAQFLHHCATGSNAVSGAKGTRLDMISFHAKGGVAIVDGHVQMNMGSQLRLHRAGFATVAAVPNFKTTPMVISEADPDGCAACPVSTAPENAYRLSPAYGAYIVTMMKRTLELEARLGVKLRGVLTWAFLFNDTPYFSGYRALSTNGIHLPVLNVFKLLGSLGGTRLPVSSTGALSLDDILDNGVRQQPDVDAIAARSGENVQILVWNYHDALVSAAASPVHVSVQLPVSFGSVARVTHLRVDETHGDAHAVWVAQGSPQTLTATQEAMLQAAMQPALLEPTRKVTVTNGRVELDFVLPRFGVSLVALVPAGIEDAPIGDSGTTATLLGSGCSCGVRRRSEQASPPTAWSVLGLCALSWVTRRRRSHTVRAQWAGRDEICPA